MVLVLAAMIQCQAGEMVKLVNVKTGFVVVEFHEGKAQFFDRFLDAELQDQGILIPPFKADQFKGKEAIYPDDPLFEKAFIEIYYPLNMAKSVYQWQNTAM